MNDFQLDRLLASAGQYGTTRSPFTEQVMKKISQQDTQKDDGRPNHWKFLRFHLHYAVILLIIVLSLSFTGYSYAMGTNPIALLKRWVTGDTVHIEYKGRTFEHGKSLTYSDAAVTAYAELNTVDALHFKADNSFQVPKNGIEHVGPAFSNYTYPWIGAVTDTVADTIQINKRYTVGDKVVPSKLEDSNEQLDSAITSIFVDGEPVQDSSRLKGKRIMVYQNSYLEYKIGSHQPAQPVTHYFVFQLSKPFDDYVKATAPTPVAGYNEAQKVGLYEPKWGGGTNLCLNNAADSCDPDRQGGSDGQSLFPNNSNNFNVVRYGEADPDHTDANLILRNFQGRIQAIDQQHITVKTSSGSLWTLAYTADQQKQFQSEGRKPLKINDLIVGSVVASTNDLDIRTFDSGYIYAMQRY